MTAKEYSPGTPHDFSDGATYTPLQAETHMLHGKTQARRIVRDSQRRAGALAAMNQALRDLANPLPPVTRTFKVLRWLRARRNALGVWYRWRVYKWQDFRRGMGYRIGSWIAGDDIS